LLQPFDITRSSGWARTNDPLINSHKFINK